MSHSPDDFFSLQIATNLFEVLKGHTDPVLMARFSPDGQFLVSTDGRSICTWKWNPKKHYMLHHTLKTNTAKVTISYDGHFIASIEKNRVFPNKVHIWTLEGELIASLSHRGDERTLIFSPEEPLLVVADDSGRLQLWDMVTFTLLCESEVPFESAQTYLNNAVRCLAFAPDGRHLAVQWYTNHGAVQIAEIVKSEGTITTWSIEWRGSILPLLLSAQSTVSDLSFSSDWRYLAVASNIEYHVWLFDALSLEPVGFFDVPPSSDGVMAITFSSDGQFLATAGCNGTVWIWDVASLQLAGMFRAHESQIGGYASVIGSIDWSQNGKWILTTGTGLSQRVESDQSKTIADEIPDYTIKLWDVKKARKER